MFKNEDLTVTGEAAGAQTTYQLLGSLHLSTLLCKCVGFLLRQALPGGSPWASDAQPTSLSYSRG